MAITEIILTESRGTLGSDKTEVTLEWLVFSDDRNDHSLTIAQQGLELPDGWKRPGTPYAVAGEFGGECIAGEIEVTDREIISGGGQYIAITLNGIEYKARNTGGIMLKYRVRQNYSTENDDDNENSNQLDPPLEDGIASIDVSFEFEDIPFTHDIQTGAPVVNSAGMPFNPPAHRRRKIPVFSYTRKENKDPLPKIIAFTNTVSGTFLMDSITAKCDGKSWTVTYNIKQKVEGWAVQLLDTGFYQRMPNGMLVPIFDELGLPLSEPAKLDGYGQALPDQSMPGVNVGPFNKYMAASFAALGIGLP